MAVARLFRTITLRHFRTEWGKLILSIVGVAIGVAVFIAVHLANTTAYSAFLSSLDAVAGRANLQVLSGNGLGFDEGIITRLRRSPAVEAAAPIIEQYAQVIDSTGLAEEGRGTPLLVFGIDFFAEAKFRDYTFPGDSTRSADSGEGGLRFLTERNAIIITDKLASRYGIVRGDSIRLMAGGRRLTFHVVNVIVPEGTAAALGGNFALLDIASAQEVFGRIGKLDRIDLLVDDKDREGVRDYLAANMPDGVVVQEPQARGAQTSKMLDAFSLNLTALAFIALFVSMFIIYNTMLTNALRRRRELGIMRAVGATRGNITLLFLSEAALLGILGSAIGIPLGVVLAQAAVKEVTQTVTALYILTVADRVTIDMTVLALGGALGVLTSIISALPSALEASRAHPRETFSVQTLERKVALSYGRILGGCAATLALGYGAALLSERFQSPLLGFLSAGLVLIGFALLTPGFIRGANSLFGRLIRKVFGVEGDLANAYLLQSLGRASTAVAALMTAIAMLVGVSTMIGSFRATVDYWLAQTITADLYMTVSSNRLSGGEATPLPEEVVRFSDSLPEAAFVDALRRIRTAYRGRTIWVSGTRFSLPKDTATLSFKEGVWEEVMAELEGPAVAVSETFALRFEKSLGDTIHLGKIPEAQGLRIAGIYYDYSSDAGSVMMRKPRFAAIYGDTSSNNVVLYLRDPSTLEKTRETIERRFGGTYSLVIYSNRSLREEALKIFDQTFAITYALQLVAIVVAAIGVANTLAALVVERSREIGILKAVGATGGQLRKMTLVQAGLIGGASQILGSVAGLALSAILIYVINRVSFGWTIQFRLSPEVLLLSSVAMIVTALIAGLGPAGAAARKRVADVVKAE